MKPGVVHELFPIGVARPIDKHTDKGGCTVCNLRCPGDCQLPMGRRPLPVFVLKAGQALQGPAWWVCFLAQLPTVQHKPATSDCGIPCSAVPSAHEGRARRRRGGTPSVYPTDLSASCTMHRAPNHGIATARRSKYLAHCTKTTILTHHPLHICSTR